jgi:hypothetical protein
MCWITGLDTIPTNPGTNDVDGGKTTLVTNTFSATPAGVSYPVISYWRWYSDDAGDNPSEDPWRVLISNNNGSTWKLVENTTKSSNAWVRIAFLVSDYVTPTSTMKMRFVAQDSLNASLVEAAVDDWQLVGYTNVADVPGPAGSPAELAVSSAWPESVPRQHAHPLHAARAGPDRPGRVRPAGPQGARAGQWRAGGGRPGRRLGRPGRCRTRAGDGPLLRATLEGRPGRLTRGGPAEIAPRSRANGGETSVSSPFVFRGVAGVLARPRSGPGSGCGSTPGHLHTEKRIMTVTSTTASQRHDLEHRLAEARVKSDELFSILDPAALYERPIPERHRLVFYLGHLEAFDWNLVARRAAGRDAFRDEFDRLFAFGIDPVGGGLPTDQPSDWPSAEQVEAYRRRVRTAVDEILAGDWSGPSAARERRRVQRGDRAPAHAHRDARLSAPPAALREEAPPAHGSRDAGHAHAARAARDSRRDGDARHAARFRSVRLGQRVRAGRRARRGIHDRFASRDERRSARVRRGGWLPAARAVVRSGRTWRESQRLEHPGFWRRRGRDWMLRGMFDERPLPLAWPAYVSQAEASAYARWKGRRLPTEAEFHRAAYGTPAGEERDYPWGADDPTARPGNYDLRRWDPTPVGAFPEGDSAFGVSELVGNGWEWTSTVFGPLPGFRRSSSTRATRRTSSTAITT